MRWYRGLTIVMSVAAVVACYRATPSARHMWHHYEAVGDVQTAVIEGDLERASASAEWVAEHETMEGLPSAAEQFQEEMRIHARAVMGAENLATAALATGQMGRSCGDCHLSLHMGPQFQLASGPAEADGDVATGMVQHLWAADRLWDGLVGPSASSWQTGAAALENTPPYETAMENGSRVAPEVQRLAQHLRELGRSAGELTEAPARAEVYGRILTTCASCHDVVQGERSGEE